VEHIIDSFRTITLKNGILLISILDHFLPILATFYGSSGVSKISNLYFVHALLGQQVPQHDVAAQQHI
jgi:hypothetical protein